MDGTNAVLLIDSSFTGLRGRIDVAAGRKKITSLRELLQSV
jgi:hypothetical protein